MCTTKIEVHTVKGDHRSMLTGESASNISKIFNNFIPK